MAYSEDVKRRTYLAGTTVAKRVGVPGFPGSVEPNVGTQYTILKMDTANKDVVELATGTAGEIIAGVAMTKAQHGNTGVGVAYAGRVPVQAGAALAVGDYVKPGAAGQAVVGVKGTDTNLIGVVVEAASAQGVLATVELILGR
jgi:Uncharacterized conserved protein (DUF2190)